MDLAAYGDQMTADGTYKAEKGKITLTSGDRSDALTIREDGSLSFIISEMDDFELILTKQDENWPGDTENTSGHPAAEKLRHESFAGPPQILQKLLFENASKKNK